MFQAAELEFLMSPWGLGTEEEEGYRTGPPGYIGWRNSFLGIDSRAPYTFKNTSPGLGYTVKRVDEVVPHRHLVTQDQTTQVSNKFFDIHVENSIINIELFRHFSQVIELVRYDYISHVELFR